MTGKVAALETRGLTKRFGALEVAGGIDFVLECGARHALIGPNGAGKTTFINLLTGRVMPSAGAVLLGGEDVTALSPDRRVRRGLGRTFQITTLLKTLTVLENVQLAILEHRKQGGRMLLGTVKAQREAAESALALLRRINLGGDAMIPVGRLPYGRQRLVDVAVALALEPTVLLLDEPAAGVPSSDSHAMLELIDALPASIAVLIIEHDMKLVFRFAKRISVLVDGRILTEGTPEAIAADPAVREIYLGHRVRG